MTDELHWGGINGKSLLRAVVSDIWMVLAVMIITYLLLGFAGSIRNTPSYTSNAVVAVYPFDKVYTLEASSDALGTVSAVNEVLNSEMFRTGLEDHLTESGTFSFSSRQIEGTYMLMLSADGTSPEIAYRTLRTALEYYEEISSHLVGDSRLEILTGPDFPLSAYNNSKNRKYQSLLTLFMGFAMAGFLVLKYAMRKTYKTSAAIRKSYKNVRFFNVADSASGKHSLRNKSDYNIVPDQENVRRLAWELWQMLRTKNVRSLFVTSSALDEGKTEITVALARELANAGRSVIIIETDPDKADLQEKVNLEAVDIPNQSINVVLADKYTPRDDFSDKEYNSEIILKMTEKLADVILVDGCIWSGSRDKLHWIKATDASLAICRQDKADFFAIDRMMTDLQENDHVFLGCVLYGF